MAGRILIVDDVATNRIVLKVKLAEAGYDALVAASAAACLQSVRDAPPDLILLDRHLPDLDGIEVIRRLRLDPSSRDIAIILTLSDTGPDARIAGFRAGADDVMTKPIDDGRLLARMRALLRAREGMEDLRAKDATLGVIGLSEATAAFEPPGTVAVVADRPERAMHLRTMLGPHLAGQLTVLSRDEALGMAGPAAGSPADLYLVEVDVGGDGGGLRLLSDLRSRSGSRHAAICMVMPGKVMAQAAMAFDLGADDVACAGDDPRETALRLGRLLRQKHQNDCLRATVTNGLRLAVIDPLTGLHNRRYAMAQLGRLLDRTRRAAGTLAVMVIDIDRFKVVNDRHGHASGDAALVEVARRLSLNLRSGDLLARIGGEEFVVALPETTLAEASIIAARLREAVDELPIRLDGGNCLSITVSIGLAALPRPVGAGADAVAALLARADGALLQSKARGRNQVTVCRSAA